MQCLGNSVPLTVWVTNHTDVSFSIALESVEVLTARGWTTFSRVDLPAGLLYFRKGNNLDGLLGPHEAFNGSMLMQTVALPTNGLWRVKASIDEKLMGAEDLASALAQEPRLLKSRLAGNTNFPMNPFRSDVSRFGHHSEAFSEEVVSP
jgi:hypothetical protein